MSCELSASPGDGSLVETVGIALNQLLVHRQEAVLRQGWPLRVPRRREFQAVAIPRSLCYDSDIAGRSSAWLERLVWVQEVASSNLVAPIFRVG